MATASAKSKNGHYDKAKKSFDHLEIEQRAKFLVEATVATLVEGIDKFSSILTSELDHVFHDVDDADAEPAKETSSKKSSTTKKTKAAKKAFDK